VTVELAVEAVVVVRARAPKEADAELPGRAGDGIELLAADAEVVEQVLGQAGRRSLAEADHTDIGAADDADCELRELALHGEGGDECIAAGAQDEHALELGVFRHTEYLQPPQPVQRNIYQINSRPAPQGTGRLIKDLRVHGIELSSDRRDAGGVDEVEGASPAGQLRLVGPGGAERVIRVDGWGTGPSAGGKIDRIRP